MSTLVSPRPTAVLPPSGPAFGPMTGAPANRASYLPRPDATVLSPPRRTLNTVAPLTESSERSKMPLNPRVEQRRPDSRGSRSDFTSPPNISISRDATTTMPRSVSRESITRKHPRHFIAKRKGSKIYRGPTPHHPVAVRSKPQVHVGFNLSMTQIQSPKKQDETSPRNQSKATNQVRPKALSMSTQTVPPPVMQRTPSEGNGNNF